ncbi:EFR1 family ferrodoxin [Methanomassiliicoccus luminyensis]|uniref:EFR1 family ferrodoxin n=1 Tax=Methanomassiliicoccus luminyensis TaxID=1080712 RepID=UPI00035DAA47|nr:EFR1 family ferrodoxin [Methanomassiliicoccus luminyensis]
MIFYFSATGNSKHVASRIAAGMGEDIVAIADCVKEQKLTFEAEEGEKIGFVAPVYFWGLPSTVRDFLEDLELRILTPRRPYIYHVATFGTTTGQAGRMVDEVLRKKGLSLDGRFSVRMPDTWTPVFDLTDRSRIEKMNREAEKEIAEVVENIRRGSVGDLSRRKVPLALVRLYYPRYETYRRTQNFTVEDSCIGCGLCARKCPAEAIEMREGRPAWVKEKCVLCLGCLHRCPKFSIQYGKGTKKHGQYINPNVEM